MILMFMKCIHTFRRSIYWDIHGMSWLKHGVMKDNSIELSILVFV